MKTMDSQTSRREILKSIGVGTAAISLSGLLQAAETPHPESPAAPIIADFSREIGRIKPLHGVNNGPLVVGGHVDLSSFHREAGFPHVRLHDVDWPNAAVVDIPAIFPLFHADPDDPANYLFAKTDAYIKSMVDLGEQIIYRLGVSIEHAGFYNTHPPKDFSKWAKICVNIIRHYNQGWADGFHYNLNYWEIWNEPNIGKRMWSGTREQYFDLYETAAKAIKLAAPSVKVGGPAISSLSSPWVRPFLQYCRDRGLPLDFFSWHLYTDSPVRIRKAADEARALLDKFGFKGTESHLNEWHYLNCRWDQLHPKTPADAVKARLAHEHMSGPEGAAFCATTLMLLQDSRIDVTNYYTADASPWGMFDRWGPPRKTYYVFRAFNELCKTPRRVACSGLPSDGTLTACAGLSNDAAMANILLSNFRSADAVLNLDLRNLPWKSASRAETFRVDATNDFTPTATQSLDTASPRLSLRLPTSTVSLVRLSPA